MLAANRDASPDRATTGSHPSGDGASTSRRGRYALLAVPLLVPALFMLDRFGIDVGGWLREVIDNLESVPPHYIALAVLLKGGESMLTALAWTHVLRATYSRQNVPYRLVLAGYQGGVALNVVAPVKAGTLANFGILRLHIRGSRIPTLISTFAVNSIAFTVFAIVNMLVVLALYRETLGEHISAAVQPAADLLDAYPLLAVALVAALLIGGALLVRACRAKIGDLLSQLAAGGAILRSPRQYTLNVFLPALAAYACRMGYTAAFMAAFEIPVRIETVLLMLGAGMVASLLAVTPGGFGVSQAVDVAVMSAYAPADVIASASLTQDIILKAWNIVFGLSLAAAVFGWQGAKALVRQRGALSQAASDPADTDSSSVLPVAADAPRSGTGN